MSWLRRHRETLRGGDRERRRRNKRHCGPVTQRNQRVKREELSHTNDPKAKDVVTDLRKRFVFIFPEYPKEVKQRTDSLNYRKSGRQATQLLSMT